MIITLSMTVLGSRPEITRVLNVEDTIDLSGMAALIDAAFGFSGTSDHFFASEDGGTRTLYTDEPTDGELSEHTLTVADIGGMTYFYDPAATWAVDIDVLGTSEIDMPSPMLVDALGPDVLEACGSPDMMSAFHAEALRLAAGLEPDLKVSPLLLSFMPVMSPERLVERLSHAHHPSVAERIAYTAENLFLTNDDELTDDPRAPEIIEEFDSFVQSRPDLQQILDLDPNPERNPTLIAAMSEFFADQASELTEEPEDETDNDEKDEKD
nr:Plasmid pRiA4b ORF-3-like protein [Streptococcus thermophilus]